MRRIHLDSAPVRSARAIAKLALATAVPATSMLIACRDPVAPVAPKLRPVTFISVTGRVGTVVSPAPTVVATDSFGRPAVGVRVKFTRHVEGMNTELATVTTGLDGVASTEWRLGTKVVSEVLNVSADGYVPVLFYARVRPGPAATVQPVGGDGQRGIAGFALPVAIRVSVTDSFGNRVPGAFVEFEVEEGGGSVTDAAGSTGADGTASTRWIIGQAGANTLRAYVREVAEAKFSAMAADAPAMPNGAKYQLNRISFTGDLVAVIPSWLVLGDDGHFVMYVQGDTTQLLEQGTYTIGNSRVRLTYADSSFLRGLWASLLYYPPDIPPTTFGNTEDAAVVNGTLVFHRCWTEDCYDCYWEYVPVP